MKKILRFSVMFFLAFSFLVSCSSDEDKLFKAIKAGNISEVKSLVENGVSVLSTNKNGLTPLEVARLNNQAEISNFIYEKVKNILEAETEKLLRIKFSDSLIKLKEIERERLKFYELYLQSNEELMNMISDDRRISDDMITDQEKYFRSHQMYIKEFINAKVDLIESILKDFIDKDYVADIESKDARHIVNVNIMYRLSKM